MRNVKFFVMIMILVAFTFAGCGGDSSENQQGEGSGANAQTINAAELAQHLHENLEFEDFVDVLDVEIAASLYNLTENEVVFEESTVYCSTGATAEEIAVFTVTEGNLEAVEEACKSRVEGQKLSFENYVPKELEKLSEPVIISEGNKVIMVVCNDADVAEELINNYGM